MNKTIKMDGHVAEKCPFCTGSFQAGFVNGVPAVAHSTPPCKDFVEMEVDVYLRAVNVAAGLYN